MHIVLVDLLLKTKKDFKNLKKQEIPDIFVENELDKACFQHDLAFCGGFKDLSRTASHKVLCDKAHDIAKYPEYERYQCRLASMVYKLFVVYQIVLTQAKELILKTNN